MYIYKNSYPFLFRLAAVLIILNVIILFAGYQSRADIIVPAASVLIFVMIALFFRVPVRKIAKDKNFVYAPADGTVIAVEELFEDEYLQITCLKVSIFMSIFNVHQNIIPVSGKIIYYKHHLGKYLVAYHPKSSFENEHTSIVIETNDGLKLMVRQIAGFVARRK
jgi:phosphatidylserine decarboxylase